MELRPEPNGRRTFFRTAATAETRSKPSNWSPKSFSIPTLPNFQKDCSLPAGKDFKLRARKQANPINTGTQRQRYRTIVGGSSVCLCGMGRLPCDNAVRPSCALVGVGHPYTAKCNGSIVGAFIARHCFLDSVAEVLTESKTSVRHRLAKHRNTVWRLFASREEDDQQRVAGKALRMYLPKHCLDVHFLSHEIHACHQAFRSL